MKVAQTKGEQTLREACSGAGKRGVALFQPPPFSAQGPRASRGREYLGPCPGFGGWDLQADRRNETVWGLRRLLPQTRPEPRWWGGPLALQVDSEHPQESWLWGWFQRHGSQ